MCIRDRFKGVNRSYIPINAILRIDEVDKRGNAKITKSKSSNIMPLTAPIVDGVTKKDP